MGMMNFISQYEQSNPIKGHINQPDFFHNAPAPLFPFVDVRDEQVFTIACYDSESRCFRKLIAVWYGECFNTNPFR